jgi:predicted permease
MFRLLNVFDERAVGSLRKFIIEVTVPFLIFKNLFNANVSDLSQVFPAALSFFIVTGLFTFLPLLFVKSFGTYFKLTEKLKNTYLFSTFMGNYAFLGWGIIYSFYGERGFTRAVFFTMFFWIVFLFWGFVLLYLKNKKIKEGKNDVFIKKALTKAVPPLIAAILGMSLNLINLKIPDVLWNFILEFAALTIPMILFTIGLNFKLKIKLNKLKIVIFTSVSRLILGFVLGLLTVFFIKIILPIDDLTIKIVLLESIMPTATMSVFFIDFTSIDKELMASIITLSTLFSLITIPMWFFVIENLI